LRRQFRCTERFSLQARGDFFNILNHPNFGGPINDLSSPQFGQATMMLNNYLGSGGQSGGLNPLYPLRCTQSADRARSNWHSNFSFKHQTARRSLCAGSLARSSVRRVRRVSQAEVIAEDLEVRQRINTQCAARGL
jgi:hypothetical protein